MRQVHVVILTAITLEYQAAKKVEAGAWEGSHWEEETGPNGLPVAFRTFRGRGDRPLRVVLAQAGGMAGVAATNALLPLVDAYEPVCVAMCGVCAGHPGKTNLGDVIAPDRLFFHDTGKRESRRVTQDLQTYNLRDDWKVKLEHVDFASLFQNEPWWKKRPVPYAWQENWVLAMLYQGVSDPGAHPACEEYCPQWGQVIQALWNSGDVEHGTRVLTEKGKKRIGPLLIEHRGLFPDLSPAGEVLPFKVHVAPMGSGNQVVEDETVWSDVSSYIRKTSGIEMEAAAIGAVAHAQRDRKLEFLVMKGVMDFANQGRDEHFKEFAARASAECLLAFLRDQLEVEVGPGVDDLLVPGTEQLPENPPPSALLHARYEVVPFHEQGRESILAELDRWCDEGPAVAARLVHAEGGIGKTRLAIEWMRRRPRGWKVGFLAQSMKEDWFERLWALGQQVVVVLDYAESRTDLRTVLLRVLRYAQQKGAGTRRRFRLLMLARNAGGWWQSLLQADAALGTWLGATPPHPLSALATQAEEREKVFREAAERFAKERGTRYQHRDGVPLADVRFERVLYLHMAALAAVEGLGFEANTLMDVVLDHEERFWEGRARQDDVALSFQKSVARQVVAAATLRGGMADANTASLMTERVLGHALSENGRQLLRLLHRIYQRPGKEGAFLPALEPDLLGEGMMLRVAAPRQEEDRVAPDWIERVFPLDAEPTVVGTGFEVLGRASAARPDVVRPWIDRLLAGAIHERGRLALEAAKRVGLRTAFSVLGDVLADQLEAQGDAQVAQELEEAGIPYDTVSLGRVGEWVSRASLQALEAKDMPPATGWFRRMASWIGRKLLSGRGESAELEALMKRAHQQVILSLRLSDLGRNEEALKATQEAVDLQRNLARRLPSDVLQSSLASSLTLLGARLNELGRREEALEAAREAVQLYRAPVKCNQDKAQADLADSLTTLGTILRGLGRREEALKANQEAVQLHRALAQHDPEAFQRDMAFSLTNLGSSLSALSRYEEALQAKQEAVALRRVLAQRNPDEFLPDLANSLTSLRYELRALRRHEEALKAVQEAVQLHRALAQRNPDVFLPGLAGSLTNLGNELGELGMREEALKASQEAVALRQALAQRREKFRLDSSGSLRNLGDRLKEVRRHEEALKAIRSAVELARPPAQRSPEAHQPYLAVSLIRLGAFLQDDLGRPEEALKATQEALALWQALAQRDPETSQPNVAVALMNLSIHLGALGRREEALKAAREALALHRVLAKRNPEEFQPNLALDLISLSIHLSALGRREEALEAAREALAVWQTLAQRDLERFEPSVARGLDNLSATLRDMGRQEEALKAVQEALVLRRAMAQRNPDAFQPDLACNLHNLGAILGDLGRHEEGLEATQEAVAIRRALARHNPEAFEPYLAAILGNLGAFLSNLGRYEEALKAMQETVEFQRTLAQRNPDAFHPALASSLTTLGMILSGMGRYEEALKATQEAVERQRGLVQRNPDALQPALAFTLNNLGRRLREVERHEEAQEAAQEAVELQRALAQRNPDAFQPALTSSLTTLGITLSGVGRREEALKATQEAVELQRALAQRNPDALQPALAVSLNNLGVTLSQLEKREEALKATQEAAELLRPQAQRNQDGLRIILASTLNNLGKRLSEVGRHEEALKATQEAAELRRALAERNPGAFQPDLTELI